MNRSMGMSVAAAALLAACSGEVRLEPADLNLLQGEKVELKVFQGDEDVTASYTFKIEGKGFDLEGNKLGAAEAGSATVHVLPTDGGDELTAQASAQSIEQVSLVVPEGADWSVGKTIALQTLGRHGDMERQLTHKVVYDISDPRVVSVDEKGALHVNGAGPVSIKAEIAGLVSNEVSTSVMCAYPQGEYGMGFGNTMPPLSWKKARWPDGKTAELNLSQMPCPGMWQDTKTVAFVLSAGWCVPCTMYAQKLMSESAGLAALGMQIVIMEVQDYSGRPANSEFAYEHLDKITNHHIPAIAVGDSDSRPQSSYVSNSGYITYFPTTFVVRTSDMKIIADQKLTYSWLPLQEIAANPDGDWSFGGSFVNKCGPGDEERGEPNNTAGYALTNIGPGEYHGGICDASGLDLYDVTIPGDWTAELRFDDQAANLDLWQWDPGTDQIAVEGGQLIGSSNGTGVETFAHSGPAMIAVQGALGSSAPYELLILEK